MFDPTAIPLTDLLQSWSSPAAVILFGAVLLVLWELAIVLGVLIAHLRERRKSHDGGHVRVGSP